MAHVKILHTHALSHPGCVCGGGGRRGGTGSIETAPSSANLQCSRLACLYMSMIKTFNSTGDRTLPCVSPRVVPKVGPDVCSRMHLSDLF